MAGWVADPTDGAPLSNVKVYVDGTLIGTPTLGIARPDVAAAYGKTAYTNSGYQLVYSAATLNSGYARCDRGGHRLGQPLNHIWPTHHHGAIAIWGVEGIPLL